MLAVQRIVITTLLLQKNSWTADLFSWSIVSARQAENVEPKTTAERKKLPMTADLTWPILEMTAEQKMEPIIWHK